MTQNVRILPNFILRRSFKWWKCHFWAKFSTWIKFSGFCQISFWFSGQECQFWAKNSRQLKISGFSLTSFFAGPEWSNSQFWSKFSPRLKISEFCQISSFACSERSKMSVLSQIFNTTENCRIFPNFILRRSLVVKNVNFEPNFQLDSKRLHFAKFILRMFWVVKNVGFEPTQLKISGFCPISSFAGSEWSKISFWAKFWTRIKISKRLHFAKFILRMFWVVKNVGFEPTQLKISGFCQIHPSHVLSGQKCRFWANTTENFRILPNFILRRSGVVKTLNFEPKFQHNWKFLDVAKFHLSHV